MNYGSDRSKIHVQRLVVDSNGFQFETQEWSLELEDRRVLSLLDEERTDPFKNTALKAEA